MSRVAIIEENRLHTVFRSPAGKRKAREMAMNERMTKLLHVDPITGKYTKVVMIVVAAHNNHAHAMGVMWVPRDFFVEYDDKLGNMEHHVEDTHGTGNTYAVDISFCCRPNDCYKTLADEADVCEHLYVDDMVRKMLCVGPLLDRYGNDRDHIMDAIIEFDTLIQSAIKLEVIPKRYKLTVLGTEISLPSPA